MTPLVSALALFYLVTFAVWTARARQALHAVRTAPEVLPLPGGKTPGPLVSIIVPARNEERNIAACVESLLRQEYAAFEILVINDNSTDATEDILKKMGAAAAASDSRLRYLNALPTPPGWTGKNFAIHQAVEHARGDWLLFTDADTRHEPGSLAGVVDYAVREKLALLTLLPRCLTGSLTEEAIQPAAMAFTGLWFPLQKINDPASPVVFGNGQFLFMEASWYRKVEGHEAVKSEFLEDFALFREVKSQGGRALCAMGQRIYGTRMYQTPKEMWRGWRRIWLHAFCSRPEKLLLKAAGVFLFSILPFALLPAAFSAPASVAFSGAAASAFLVAIAWKGHSILKVRPWGALFHPLAAAFCLLILLDAAWMAVTRKPTRWR